MEKTIQDVTSGLSQTTQASQSGLPDSTPTVSETMPPLGMASTPRPPARQRRTFVVVIILLILAALGVLAAFLFRPQQLSQEVSSRFETIQIPLDDFLSGDGLALLGTRNLTINGRLQANDAFIISPSTQPTNGTAGQIYYDQASNELAYYNGSEFVTLPGNVTTGEGIASNGGQLTNTGVLSLQGQTGNISLTSGGGIAIDGTTLTNTGVLSLAGATGDITLGSGLTMNGNELGSSGVNSLTAGTANLVIANDGAGNLTISDVGGGSGTVTSGGGTPGRIAKFTGLQNIEDSLISESGATITVNGDLQVTGATTLNNALTVGNGGTGATSLANDGVVISHGTGAFTSVAAGGPGLCLMSTASTPTFAACPGGGGGVDSLNGLSGALTLANSTGAGTTITINDASTSQKGIAQFNAANFTTVAGLINTVQDIHAGASPTFANLTLNGDLAVNGGDLTSTGALNITPGGTLVVGSPAQTLTLQGGAATTLSATSGANTTTLTFQTPASNVVYRLATAGAGTYDLCSTAGNCAGVGGGVTTPGGTINRLAKFSSAQGIADSTVTDDGTNVSTTVDLIVQGGDVTVGVANSQTGRLTFAHSGSGFLGTIVQGPLSDNRTYTLPNASGEFCMTSGNCSGSGSNSTLQAAYDAGNIITTTSGRDLDIVLADTTVDSNFDIAIADGSTSFVSISRADGAGTSDPAQLVLVDNLDTNRAVASGIKLQSAAGGMTTAIDASDAEIGDALNAGANNIVGTVGNIDLTNFDVTGATGNITTAGDLALNGGDLTSTGALNITPGGALTLGVTGQTATLQGSLTTITSNGAGNDIVLNAADTIELQDATNITGNLTVNGTAPSALVVKASTNGDTSLVMNVLQNDNDSIMRLTDTGTLAVGNNTNIVGVLSLLNGAGGDFAEIRTINTTSTIYQLPEVGGGTVTFCTTGGNCGATIGTLQAAYGYSAGGTTPEIKLDATRNGIEIQDANTTIGSGQNFLSLRGPNASGLGSVLVGFGTQGNLFMQPSANRVDLVDINTNGGANLLTVDSINSRVGIGLGGTNLPAFTLDVGGTINTTGAATFGSTLAFSTLGVANTDTHLCRNASNQIAACSTTGTAFVQGGNSFAGTGILGTNDANALEFETSNTSRMSIGATGGVTVLAGNALTVTSALTSLTGATNGDALRVSNSTSTGNIAVFSDNTTAVATIADGGLTTFQNSANSPTAFRILNASGSGSVPQFVVDTSAARVYIGNPAADGTGALLVLDTKNTAGDPAGINGGMYFNSSIGRFRCFEANIWGECLGVPKPNTRRVAYFVADGNGSLNGYGDGLTQWGSAGASAGTSAPPTSNYATNGFINDFAGVEGENIYGVGGSSYQLFQTQITLIPDITSVRIWLGLTELDLTTMSASATPSGGEYVAFRYDTSAGDTTWKCVTYDGISRTILDTGISPNAANGSMEIIIENNTRAIFKIDDSIVCNTTATIPVAYTARIVDSITALTASVRTLPISWIYVESGYNGY